MHLQAQVPARKMALGVFPTPVHTWQPPGVPPSVSMLVKRDDLTGMQLSGNKVRSAAKRRMHPEAPHTAQRLCAQVRKLEFLIAAAKERGHDSVITIGGIQSNHCRATAVAARQVLRRVCTPCCRSANAAQSASVLHTCRYAGMDCHLILRNAAHFVDQDPGLTGNLLVERLVGCHIHQARAPHLLCCSLLQGSAQPSRAQVTKEEYVRVGSVVRALCCCAAVSAASGGR